MKQPSASLLHRHSPMIYLRVLGLIVAALFLGSIFQKYVLAWSFVPDDSMAPHYFEGDLVLICKLPFCRTVAYGQDYIISPPDVKNNRLLLRRISAISGDSLHIRNSHYKTAHGTISVQRDPFYPKAQTFYIPKAGDTLHLAQLDFASFDLAHKIFRQQTYQDTIAKQVRIVVDGVFLPDSKLKSFSVSGRMMDYSKLPLLTAQEMQLLHMQLAQHFRNQSITMEQLLLQNGQSVTDYIVKNDYFFTSGLDGRKSLDSRQYGFISQKAIYGKVVKHFSFTSQTKKEAHK
jgi:signal peptidase I